MHSFCVTRLAFWSASFCLAGVLVVASGCGPLTLVLGASPTDQVLQETIVLRDGRGRQARIALIDVSGPIVNADRTSILSRKINPVSTLSESLQKAAKDHSVRAVVLRVNTPGGGVTATDAMYREVLRFRKATGKPVVVLGMDVMASGGYYLACAGDEIVVYPSSIVGSIGVIIQTISFKPALARLGVQAEALTSGPNKDAGSPLSVMTAEHRAVLQSLVDEFYGNFREVVRDARPDVEEAVFTELTDGRVISGRQAVKHGLADAEGDLYTAFDRAKQRAGLKNAILVRYHRPLAYVGSPYAGPVGPSGGAMQINLAQFNVDAGVSRPAGAYYLWTTDAP